MIAPFVLEHSATCADSKEIGAIWWENAALREAAFCNSAEAKEAAAEGLKLYPASQGVQVEAALAYATAGDTARAQSLAQDLEFSPGMRVARPALCAAGGGGIDADGYRSAAPVFAGPKAQLRFLVSLQFWSWHNLKA